MAPDKEAQRADGENREDHGAITKDRLAREGRNNVRCRPHAREDRDVNFWVAKKPEQVLPKQRRAARVVGDQGAAHVQVPGNEEAGSGDSIQQQKDSATEQHRKRKQREHRRGKPRPAGQRHAH